MNDWKGRWWSKSWFIGWLIDQISLKCFCSVMLINFILIMNICQVRLLWIDISYIRFCMNTCETLNQYWIEIDNIQYVNLSLIISALTSMSFSYVMETFNNRMMCHFINKLGTMLSFWYLYIRNRMPLSTKWYWLKIVHVCIWIFLSLDMSSSSYWF